MQGVWTDFLNLDKKQKEKLRQWLELVDEVRYKFLASIETEEEDCCMTGPLFTITASDSGIGPNFSISYEQPGLKLNCHLAYDDDGELH